MFRTIGKASCIFFVGSVGCTAMQPPPAAIAPAQPEHPLVKLEGNDGTVLTGELMNGSITIECGQGELTLLTDHIDAVNFDKEGDSIMSPSVKVVGKIEETEFRLKNEHGVFKLLKQNLHSISFANAPSSTRPSPRWSPTSRAQSSEPAVP